MSSEGKIILTPIGFVRTNAVGDEVKDKNRLSQIIIHDELAEALDGIAGFSHLFVLFWLHEISDEQRKTLKSPSTRQKGLAVAGSTCDANHASPKTDWVNAG
jgi:tRNA (Thr-GGU) A37 N-methylase